jgi:putative ABC transport system permease protein
VLNAQWRKAPLVLRHHPTVLVAVAAAAFLVALAAASSPFVRAAAGSVALKNKLEEFSPYSAGLQIRTNETRQVRPVSVHRALREAAARDEAVARLAQRVGFLAEPLTATTAPQHGGSLNATSPDGFTQVRLMTRTGALEHVRVLSQAGGEGVWLSHLAADALNVEAGDRFELVGSDFAGGGANVGVRVKGIYRALAYEAPRPYWFNFSAEIFPADLDSPPPPTFAFADRSTAFRLVKALGGSSLETVYELPVDPGGLTLDTARSLAARFEGVQRTLDLPHGALARRLHCTPEFRSYFVGSRSGCGVSSSLPSAITIADSDVSAVSPVVRLLSLLGIGIALAVAAAAGVFAVRRRRAESALAFARGEHVASFSARTALEALLATIAGGIAGFAVAYALTGTFAPDGTVNGTTFRAGAWQSAAAVATGLGLLTLTAALAYLRLFDTGIRRRRWPRWLVWELPLLVLATLLLVDLERGGGLAQSGSSDAQHPTLAVFVFPLLLVAAVTGFAVRVVRAALRRGAGRGRGFAVPVYLALRRLGAARGLLVVLAVVSAVSFGAFFYAQALADSLTETTDLKAYTANGSDVAAIVSANEVLPRRFRFPLTKVQFGNGAAAANTSTGEQLDLLLVDPRTLPGVLHWQDEWGADPTPLLEQLASAPVTPLPVIATADAPALRAISLQGESIPVRRLGDVSSFPGKTPAPMVITSAAALEEAADAARIYDPLDAAQTYVWAKGPSAQVAAALADAGVDTYYMTTVDSYRDAPDVLLATRTYAYLRTIAIAGGILVLVGLLLYLQARQRSQTIASALGRRMGLSRAAETASLCLEIAGIMLFAGVVGGVVALAAARPVVEQLDTLPDRPPPPVFVTPTASILLALAALAVLAIVTGLVTSWLARRADVSEALRVA